MQTKNVNVVQPSANKNEKNAAAAAAMNAANQSGQAVNGLAQNGGPLMNGTGINNPNNGRASGSVPTVNGTGGLSVSAMNGLNVTSSAINGGVPSAAPPTSHYHPLPATSSYIQMPSPYQPLPVTSSHHQPVTSPYQPLPVTSSHHQPVPSPYQPLPVTSSHHQPITSPYQPLPVTSSHHQPVTSPYQPLPVTSSHHQPVTSQYQPQPVTSQPGLPVTSTPYQPPPLPPRVGSSHQREAPTVTSSGGCLHSVYKPVPPPKPFSGPVATSATVTSSSSSGSGASPAGEQEQQQQQQQQQQHLQQGTLSLRDQLAALTGSTLPASAAPPPPLLPHILVTDQGHFHTHSTKFPIETKEGPSSLPSGSAKLHTGQASGLIATGWANLSSSWAGPFSRSATLGRGAKGVSSGLAGMGVAKGSTLPRSGAPPPTADLRPPTAAHTHPHHTHAGSGVGGGEDRDQLLAGERHQRFLDGIDNPALVDDAHMPSYRGPGGGMHTAHPSIPPEGTLAGVLPSHPHQRPCESPFLSRPPYRPPTLQQHQTATPQHHPATSQHHPATSQHHLAASQHHPATSNQQTAFTRETWVRSSHGQFSGIVEIHPHQSHLQMNGHASQHHATTSGHIPNGNTHVHANSHPEGPYSHSSGHHTHMNGHQDSVNSHNSQNNRTAGPVDDNHANNSQERDDAHKDDKWGSLTRGLAARKYQHLKEKLSSKFSRGDKPDDRTTNSQADSKTMTSQGTNTSSTGMNISGSPQQEASGIQPEPSRDSGRIAKLNTSFRKAIHQSSQKTNLQETMETSLSTNQEQGGLSQHGSVLPPHYSRNPSQYQSQQALAGPGLPPATHRAALPPPMSSPNLSRQHQHDPLGRGLANRRSGSYHHLAQLRQEPPSWRSHHYSVENLVDAHALPSDHTYSGQAVSSGHSQTTGGEGVGSGGSDSGRGTAGSGGESRVPNALDTSLDSAASQRQNNQGHSSGNDSEWVDMTDAELQHIMKKGSEGKTNGGLVRRESLAATPPLPPLSPEGTPQPSPRSSPPRHRKYSLSYSCNGLNKPDLLEAAGRDGGKRTGVEGRAGSSSQNSSQSTPRRGGTSQMQQAHSSSKGTSTFAGSSHRSLGVPTIDWSRRKEDERQRSSSYDPLSKNKSIRVNMGPSGGDLDTGDMTSTTDALDLDSMLDGVTEATTDDDAASACDPDVHLIRKQLEGLEGMYSEVLKLLGGRRKGRHTISSGVGLGDLKTSHRRLHGSLSSLPSSIVSSRPGRDKRRVIDDRVRKIGRDGGGKSIHKRFQRLESHVVTLARSVAHLSSEMRTQHLMFQEIESIRGELSALRTGGSGNGGASNTNRSGGHVSWESFRAGIPGLSNPSRVKKLTQFFGDEPPLVRIFLRKLGYEKYAGLFEQEKIGMLELPYLTEERLQKIGIPMGPRLRILQEAQGPIRKEGNLSVYVV